VDYNNGQPNLRVKSLEWGRSNEKEALRSYRTYHLKTCQNVTIENRGLFTTEFFIPSTVKIWNRLGQSDRNLDTLTKLKKKHSKGTVR